MDIHLRPPLSRPIDFNSFWRHTWRELSKVAPAIRRQLLPHPDYQNLAMEEVSFSSLGNVRIFGYLIRWKSGKKRPLVVHSHGYQSQCVPQWKWALAGMNVLGVDIRGFGKSREALPVASRWGYVLTGIESPETYVLREAVCDYARAVEVALEMFGPSVERLVLHGKSFAGGLALMAEAVSPAADLLALEVPSFGWPEGRQFFVKSGSGSEVNRFLARRPESAEDLMEVLRYFDPVNSAPDVQCPALVGVGLNDDVVPACTVYAIINHLSGPCRVVEFPVSHSDSTEEQQWSRFQNYWQDMALIGVPPDFGFQSQEQDPSSIVALIPLASTTSALTAK